MTPGAVTQDVVADVRAEALRLAALGWRVHPIGGDKRPLLKGWPKEASSDQEKVAAMPWHRAVGVGIATGEYAPGRWITVVDLDPPSGGIVPGDPAAAAFHALLKHVQDEHLSHVVVQTAGNGLHLYVATDAAIKNGVDVLTTQAAKHCAVDLRGVGGFAVGAGEAFYSVSGAATKSRAETMNGGRVGWYATITGGDLGPADLGVVPVAVLVELGLCGPDGGRPAQRALQAPQSGDAVPGVAQGLEARPASAARAAGGGRDVIEPFEAGPGGVGDVSITLLPEGGGGAVALPAHLTGQAARQMAAQRRSDPGEVKAALMLVIAAAQAAGEDTAGYDWWSESVLFPLAGCVVRGSLTEAEARPIYDRACAACGGIVDDGTEWDKAVRSAADRLTRGVDVRGAGSIFDAAKAAGWVAPGEVLAPETGGAVPGRKGQLTLARLEGLIGGAVQFGTDTLRQAQTLDIAAPVPGLHLAPGQRQALDDRAVRQLRAWLELQAGRAVPEQTAWQLALTLADRTPYNPAHEWLIGLPQWDGTPRLDTWLIAYAGALDDGAGLHRQFGRLTVLALVARIVRPGCKWDHVLTLVGGQGAGKSTVARIMAGKDEWFGDSPVLGLDGREVLEQTRGKLVIELSELARGRQRELEHEKAFLTRPADTGRPAYARAEITVQRGFVFVATTNDEAFLHDPTGNRRWWPVKVGRIDTDALRRDWPEIMAEAVHVFVSEFGADPARVTLDPAFYAAAREAQETFTSPDQMADDLRAILRPNPTNGQWHPAIAPQQRVVEGRSGMWVAAGAILTHLNAAPGSRERDRIKNAMADAVTKRLGWERGRHKTGTFYRMPDDWLTADDTDDDTDDAPPA